MNDTPTNAAAAEPENKSRTSPTETIRNHVPQSLKQPTPGILLRQNAELYEKRNAEYGGNYQRIGGAILALFPEGGVPALRNAEDIGRFAHLLQAVNKLQRYAMNFERGGHLDSARDLQVYAAMLEETCTAK